MGTTLAAAASFLSKRRRSASGMVLSVSGRCSFSWPGLLVVIGTPKYKRNTLPKVARWSVHATGPSKSLPQYCPERWHKRAHCEPTATLCAPSINRMTMGTTLAAAASFLSKRRRSASGIGLLASGSRSLSWPTLSVVIGTPRYKQNILSTNHVTFED